MVSTSGALITRATGPEEASTGFQMDYFNKVDFLLAPITSLSERSTFGLISTSKRCLGPMSWLGWFKSNLLNLQF